MRSLRVVELDEPPELRTGVADRVIGAQVDVLVLDGAPQAFDEDVVTPATPAIHADLHAALLQGADEVRTRELTALVRVEDLGPTVPGKGLLERVDAERRIHAD